MNDGETSPEGSRTGGALSKGAAAPKGDAARAERLRAALRENLKRRKAQARGRRQDAPGPFAPDGSEP